MVSVQSRLYPKAITVLLVTLLAAHASACSEADVPSEIPQSIILFIGDGTGVAQWSAGLLAGRELAVRAFPVVGLVETSSTSGPVTDSGAAATALAAGVKTYNRAIGVDPDSAAADLVFETARQRGMTRGVVATSSVVHATPASFFAHAKDRYQYYDIAAQAVDAELEVMLGGGRQFFDSEQRPDGRDLLGILAGSGVLVETAAELEAVDPDSSRRLTGLFADDDMPPAAGREPTLSSMTEKALAALESSEHGFFLMVEGSQIDWVSHDNAPLEDVVAEVADLDAAIRVAVRYADRRPGTLIVVTADHATGGLAIVDRNGQLEARYAHGSHSAELVPLFARGPAAERFGGLKGNDEIGRLLLELVAAHSAPN